MSRQFYFLETQEKAKAHSQIIFVGLSWRKSKLADGKTLCLKNPHPFALRLG